MITLPNVPRGSVLGLNYSGAHDSSIAIVAPDGRPVFAISLERVTRVKQDGRWPEALLRLVPWDSISSVALSTYETAFEPDSMHSRFLPSPLPVPRPEHLQHGPEFFKNISLLPCPVSYSGHQASHAALAFFGSGFERALCLTYDGGMHNDPWFGGVFNCARGEEITAVDLFDARHYAKITSLYTLVTALLGFKPNRHEGKITGLAALGSPNQSVLRLLHSFMTERYFELEMSLQWFSLYSQDTVPVLFTDEYLLAPFRSLLANHKREDIAASLQRYCEDHISAILCKVLEAFGRGHDLCLSGGLFSNVKINQKICELGFSRVFVSPPMTDDGTALGAAWCWLCRGPQFDPPRRFDTCLGPSYDGASVQQVLRSRGVRFSTCKNPAQEIAQLLAAGQPVALFQGAAEFGPRALGNRSIVAPASDPGMPEHLNRLLNRTEFMPFAPVTLGADAADTYHLAQAAMPCLGYMTTAVNCTDNARDVYPAIVHVDGTARPQLVPHDGDRLLLDILHAYKTITGKSTLINTSFNVHEKPIVCSPDDALDDFFESGLGNLYIEGGGLVAMAGNEAMAIGHFRQRFRQKSVALEQHQSIAGSLCSQRQRLIEECRGKQLEIDRLVGVCDERLALIDSLRRDNAELRQENAELRKVSHSSRFTGRLKILARLWFGVKLGVLRQHPPIPLQLPAAIDKPPQLKVYPKVSVVTPSYGQAGYIAQTMDSVLGQGYPNIEYFVQDGGSTDGTVEILESYSDRLSRWESRADKGQTNAINLGFAQSTGEIMCWLNSDDLLLPGALARVVDCFNARPDVDVVYGNRILIDGDGWQVGRWVLPGHDDKALHWADFVPQETLFWRRRIWEKVGGTVDESFRFAMDWDLLLRFQAAGARFYHLPHYLGAFRVHEQQKTSADIGTVGIAEMARLRERCHGRPVTDTETAWNLVSFLLRHRFADARAQLALRVGGVARANCVGS